MGDERSNGKIRRFEDLDVWKAARQLAKGVYRAGQSQSLREDRALASQMRRAAVSIASNIAEGFERGTRRQHSEFCYIAKGSAGELRGQIIIAHDVGLIDQECFDWQFAQSESVSRQLHGYIGYLRRTSKRLPGPKYLPPETDADMTHGE